MDEMANRYRVAAKRAKRATGAPTQKTDIKDAAEASYTAAPTITAQRRKSSLEKDVRNVAKMHKLQKLAGEFERIRKTPTLPTPRGVDRRL